jgi:hypothetical protein
MSGQYARGLGLAASLLVLGRAPSGQAGTVCDTDPKAVPFEATVNPTSLNKLLARLGNQKVRTPNVNFTLPGLCVDHQIPIATGVTSLPFGDAPFMVTPASGSIQVDLTLAGPFAIGIDGGRYRAVNCDSSCVIELPYIGVIFNGCDIESGLVKPVLSVLSANASWDDIHVSQVADTCVLGDCTAVHPLEGSSVSLTNFDVNLVAGGTCNVFLDFPDPIPDIGPFDLCAGIDSEIADLLRPVLEDQFNGVFVKKTGGGLLIDVFSNQIVKDFGCVPIPEVRNCKKAPPVAGLVRSPRDYGLNALFYSLPLGVAGVLSLRLRRRSGPKAPPA